MITKKEFFTFMSEVYEDEPIEDELYKSFKALVKVTDPRQIKELKNLVKMNTKERLIYRYSLAANGKEYTPRQVDQYLTMIEFALDNLDS